MIIGVYMILKFSKHAKKMMVGRGVTKEQVIRALKMGSKIRQTDGYLSSYAYIEVAYKKKGDIYKIKTIKIKD